MVDYVKVATAGTTNLAATNAWTPSGVPASVTNDTATFNATSLGGSLSGNFTTRRLSFNGATAAVTHSGTITLGADGFQFGTGNTVGWTQSGTVAVGAINQTWSIYTPGANFLFSNVTANLGLTGTGNITVDNADAAATTTQSIWFQGQNTISAHYLATNVSPVHHNLIPLQKFGMCSGQTIGQLCSQVLDDSHFLEDLPTFDCQSVPIIILTIAIIIRTIATDKFPGDT